MIKGSRISFRAVEREDLATLKEWRNNEDFRKFFREYRELNMDNQELWFNEYILKRNDTVMFMILKNDENKTPIGCAGLCYINWVNRNADLSLYIGENDAYIDEKGYAKEATEMLFAYGFGELCLNKLWTEIYEFDTSKYALYTELGMIQDGLLRENYFHKGKFHDSRIMSILAKDYYKK